MTTRMKRAELFKLMISYLQDQFKVLPDHRTGENKSIAMHDVGMAAFSVFFNQCPSFLEFQRIMLANKNRCNAQSLFGIQHIPSDNHIRQLLDPIPAATIYPVFHYGIRLLEEKGLLQDFRCLKDQLLIAVDGLHYYYSKCIHCNACSVKHHQDGTDSYAHSMVSATIVHPNHSEVLPLPPEFIEPQDGASKQDCEINAFKRWLKLWGKHYAAKRSIILGDDLYNCEPVCLAILAEGLHFILTCKESSHQTIYEYVNPMRNGLPLIKQKLKIKDKSYEYQCRYMNQIPLKNGEDVLLVNWCSLEVFDRDHTKVYSGAFTTDLLIDDRNVAEIAHCGRTRWKTENEHNNTLKNHGYFLEHNYGHGKQHLSSLLATLILLSFFFHTLLMLLDARYNALRHTCPRRLFFQQLRTLMFFMYFASWDALMELMVEGWELDPTLFNDTS